MISVSKIVLEFLLVVLGLMTAVATGVFSFTTYKNYLATSKLKLDITTAHTNFAVKMQRNVDNLRVEMGIAKCDIRDMKGAMKRHGLFHDRAGFPDSNVPESTGWDIKE